ncbi:uncharacterized protein LOC131207334 [Anopheles bellator]|uniref:uncharacterized protein LOC131207334 n=1 Tax=Anopheles bellator TaxID=139047 RepID=UPI002648CC42|nr:uncharacterized protein LOC131207334 [Anopheles bellator]
MESELLRETDNGSIEAVEFESHFLVPPEHSDIGVVLLFGTTGQFVSYCEDLHPVHAQQRHVHGNYLVHLEQQSFSAEKLCTTITALWNYSSILNLMLSVRTEWSDQMKIYFYNPFEAVMGKRLVEYRAPDEAPAPFADRRLNIFNGIPIRCTVFARNPSMLTLESLPESFRSLRYVRAVIKASNGRAGLDGMLMGNLAMALNFSARTMDDTDGMEYGYRQPNGTLVGSLGDLVYHRSDVSFNIRFMKDYDTHEIEFLHPIYTDQLCILAPKSLEIPQWVAIFLCFHPLVWGTFVVVGFAGGYLWYGLRRWALRKVRRYRVREMRGDPVPYSTLAIELWLVLLGASSVHLPVRVIERVLLAAFLVANVIISGTFQGTLTTAFSTVTFYQDIDTLEALDRSGLPIGTSSRSLRDIFGNDSASPLYRSLTGKLQILNMSARNRAAFQRDICSIERRSDVSLIINTEYIRPNGQPMLHVVQECPRVYSLAYIVRRGWSLAPLFNDAIYRFVEAGLCRKWYDDTEYALTVHQRIQSAIERPDEDPLRKLTMVDMQTSFYIATFGVLVSVAIFAIELFLGKGPRRQRVPTANTPG